MKSHFGEGGKDAAVDVDVNVGMAAIFWDRSVGLYIFSHCVVGYINCENVKEKKNPQCLPLPLPLPQLLNLIKDQ